MLGMAADEADVEEAEADADPVALPDELDEDVEDGLALAAADVGAGAAVGVVRLSKSNESI
jgi:hypothetical protein